MLIPIVYIYQDLSYGDILAGQPGAWLVKDMFCMHAITKFQKEPYIEIQNNIQNIFMIAFTVYE